MSTQVIAVAQVQGLVPASETEIKIVQDSHEKLGEILEKVVADFKADVLKLAGTVTSAKVENFPIDNFVNNWTQLLERFRNRTGAVASFRLELSNVREVFKKEHAAELIAAFQQKLAALELELRLRNEVDEVIAKEIAETKTIIEELKRLGTKKGGTYQGQATSTKKTPQVASKAAVRQVNSSPTKATTKKRSRKASRKATKK